jgi:hypothetical protein
MTAPRQPLPWLRLDPAELGSAEAVQGLTYAQLGAHASLLETAWRHDGLPADPSELMVVRARGRREFKRLWPAIERLWPLADDGRRRNPWLEQQRSDSIEMRRTKAANRRGGERPSDDRSTAVEPPCDDRSTAGCLPDQTSTTPTDSTVPDQPTATDGTDENGPGSGELRSGADGSGSGLDGPDITGALVRLGFGQGSGRQFGEVLELRNAMREQGLDNADVRKLIALATVGDNPPGLLRTWVERKECAKVLSERRNGRAAARRRVRR